MYHGNPGVPAGRRHRLPERTRNCAPDGSQNGILWTLLSAVSGHRSTTAARTADDGTPAAGSKPGNRLSANQARRMTEDSIRIGDAILKRSRNTLDVNGRPHVIEPLAAELLAYLAKNAGSVVSLDDLHDNLWTDRVVTDSSVYRQIAELRRLLGDDARAPRYIETIRKRGYRLIADVGPVESPSSTPAEPPASTAPSAPARRGPWLAAAGALLAVLVLAWYAADRTTQAGSTRPTIAVTPFDTLSPDTPDYAADAVAWALSDRLAGIAELRVPAFPAVRELAKQGDAPSDIARKLRADLIVSGSVSMVPGSSGDAIDVRAVLVDAKTSEQLFTASESGRLAELMTLRERLAIDVAQQLDLELRESVQDELFGSDPDLYETLLQAHGELEAGVQADNLTSAIELYTSVLERNDESLPALAGRAVAHVLMYNNFFDRSDERLALARVDARRALELDGDAAEALYAAGHYESIAGDPEAARELLQKAVGRRPSSARAWLGLGRNARRLNDLDGALAALRESVLLDPQNAVFYYELGLTEFFGGEYLSAERSLRTALGLNADMIEPHLYIALLYVAWLGDSETAASELRRLADKIGQDELMQILLLPGTWGFFTYAGDELRAALETWSVAENGGDAGAWHLAMAELATERGDAVAARGHYQRGVELRRADVATYPADPWYLAELAIAYAGLGDGDEALAAADRALTLAPPEEDPWTNADFLWLRAMVLKMLGLEAQTVQQVRAALHYRSLITPLSLREDPSWSSLFANAEFLALMTADGQQWKAWVPADAPAGTAGQP